MSDRQDLPVVHQFIRFAIVGCIQNGLNLVVFALTVAAGVPYLLASVLAAAAALSVSFVLNLRWTFSGRMGSATRRAGRYVAIWVTIVVSGLPVLAILVGAAHLSRVLAQAIVILVGAPVSYGAQRRWTFGVLPIASHRPGREVR